MQLNCKTCGAPLKADNINLDTFFAKCEYCHAISYFGEEMRPSRTTTREYETVYRGADKDSLARPKRLNVSEQGGELLISYRWFTCAAIFLLFFCVAWDSFLVFWYSMGIVGDAPWIMFVFPIVHVAVGVALTYYTLCLFINSTKIRVTSGEISISNGPLPSGGNQRFAVSDLDQLYCVEKISRNKNGSSYAYNVMAKLRTAGHKKLLSGFEEPSEAIYLERLIEKHLGIEDNIMAGEHPI